MTLNDLREQLKAAYPAARQSYASNLSANHNMRQFWKDVQFYLKWYSTRQIIDRHAYPEPHSSIVRFYQAGEIYYHAKQHGIESAVLLKLSRA